MFTILKLSSYRCLNGAMIQAEKAVYRVIVLVLHPKLALQISSLQSKWHEMKDLYQCNAELKPLSVNLSTKVMISLSVIFTNARRIRIHLLRLNPFLYVSLLHSVVKIDEAAFRYV